MPFALRAALLSATLLLSASGMAQPILDPAPIATFDGNSWSGLVLDKDRDTDIKKKFKTEKGAVRPEALKLVPERGGTVRVDALLDGRGGNAVMRAIRVEYKGRGPALMDLVDAWDERPVEMYQRGRTEDWHIEVFEKKGVIAMVMKNETHPSVFVLADPDRVAVVQRQFVDGVTTIERPRDPGEGWDRVVRYSYVNLNLDVDGSRPDWMNNRWMDDLRDSLRDEARNFRGDTLRSGGGSGTLNVNLTTSRFNNESASFKVSLSLFTKTPYGDLSRFSDESRTIDYSHRARAVELLRTALREMDNIVRAQVRNYGPEPVEAARNRAMDAVYKAASGA